jgi:hypothetical protein
MSSSHVWSEWIKIQNNCTSIFFHFTAPVGHIICNLERASAKIALAEETTYMGNHIIPIHLQIS